MKYLYPIFAIIFALILWFIFIAIGDFPPFILPSPIRVAKTWWASKELIFEHSIVTLIEVFWGLLIGGFLGCITAISLVQSSILRSLMRPLLVFSQALPVFALAPILTLWLGYGLWSKVAMAVLIIYFPITSSFFDGLMRTPKGYLDLAQTMQAKPFAIMWRVRIPAALPSLASGIKLAAVYAPIGAVIGEWVGSSQGLGYLMLLANGRAKTDLMFAAMLTLGVLSVLLYLIANFAGRKLEQRHGII